MCQVAQLLIRHALLIVLALPCSAILAAENREQTQSELESVATAIADIQQWLASANQRHSDELETLRETELALSASHESVSALESNISALRAESDSLHQTQRELETAKTEQEEVLAILLRAAYMSGESQYLKLLLNGEDVSEGSRLLNYARRLSEYQRQQISRHRETLASLASTEADLQENLNALESDLQLLQDEQQNLITLQQTRSEAVTTLQRSIASRSSELEQLEMDRAELEMLLVEIARAMEGVRSFADVPPFAEQRGDLAPPIPGPVLNRFGESYGGGSLSRQGIVLGAATGTPVEAVHAGQIAFANWLRGSGLLVVIDHGEGFMSLYSGNEALAVSAGDWVDSGDVIATSGNGIGEAPGIYFEIRRNGQPVNPSSWLQP